jgi:hypothetical protein
MMINITKKTTSHPVLCMAPSRNILTDCFPMGKEKSSGTPLPSFPESNPSLWPPSNHCYSFSNIILLRFATTILGSQKNKKNEAKNFIRLQHIDLGEILPVRFPASLRKSLKLSYLMMGKPTTHFSRWQWGQ